MDRVELSSSSVPELRDRLRMRIERIATGSEERINTADLDLQAVLDYFVALPESEYTSDGADALIHLARNYSYAAKQAEMLQAASLAARMAIAAGDLLLLSRARNKEGIALAQLGRLVESFKAQTQAWLLAHDLGDKRLEMLIIWGFTTVCTAMGQWNACIRYCERMRLLAEELGLAEHEFIARSNVADCAIQLRDPIMGLRALSANLSAASQAEMTARARSHLHNNLGRLYLLLGDVAAALVHAEAAVHWATIYGQPHVVCQAEALRGLVSVWSGDVQAGLEAVSHTLTLAKGGNQVELPNCLAMCIDAYEAAGDLDRALAHLQELVDWKKELVNAEVMALPSVNLTQREITRANDTVSWDGGLHAKARVLQSRVQDRIERLIEIAMNAEMSSGHDPRRPFRVAKLAEHFARALNWDELRITSLVLAAQLSNIGMVAIPARILLKPGTLSSGERHALQEHTRYGAELLRKANLQILDMASTVAEQHHERHDGAGYPYRLSGDGILQEARMIAICDAVDAMTQTRPWRSAFSIDEALCQLEQASGSQFDPTLLATFVELIRSEFWRPMDLGAFLVEGADQHEYVNACLRMEAVVGTGSH